MILRLVALWMTAAWACATAAGQGTKLWTVERYDDLAKGTSEGVAIRSDGRLEPGPATSLLATTAGSYVWSLATDAAGNGYAGLGGPSGGTAAVLKVTPEGRSSKVFESKELAVQALRLSADGPLLIGTSPDGKLYRLPSSGGPATVLFDPAQTEEKPKYLWDIAEIGNSVFVATGAPAAVYRLRPGAKPELLFRTTDQHIRCLLAAPDGTLWAGSDGAGVVYRIKPLEPGARPFAAYAAPRREITALALDLAGNLYAAGVGAKAAPSSLPPLPVTGAVGVSITFVQPGSTAAAGTNAIVPEGSEIYRIASDGAPTRLLALKDDVVYALAVRNGTLLAATGNRGRVYKVDTAVPGRFTEVAHLDAAQAMAFAPTRDGLLVATSNSGKLFKLRDRLASPAIYTSAVFDAQAFAQWGRAEVRSDNRAAIDLYARSGNVESPLMGWSDWLPVAPDARSAGVPSARFAQWKAVLRDGGTLDAVALNFLQANAAPVIDEIVVQPGARVSSSPPSYPTTVQVSFPAPPSATPPFSFSTETAPLTAQKDRTAVTVRWAAHDDNSDDLLFAVFYKGTGERNWHLLKDRITDRFLSFDASLLPDGGYTLKVTVSDAPAHTAADARTTERVSEVFVVDTTPPSVTALHLAMTSETPTAIHVTAEAQDATSPIAHAEYSLDAGPWQFVEPSGRISDATTERYDFSAALPTGYSHDKLCALAGNDQHILAIRVYDRFDNVSSAKATVEKACVTLTTTPSK